MIRIITVFFVLLVMAGCGTPISTGVRPAEYYSADIAEPSVGSLFSADAAVLSDEAIGRILEFDYSPPKLGRIALIPFGREVWSGWSEELSVASDQMRAEVLERLKSSPRVYDVSYLPSILIPEQKSVPHLREAAARYQADLLLVYRSYCRNFERYRFFAANRSKAYCGVEAVLLDTRTGLVPFTSVVLKTFESQQSGTDVNFRETVLKAQLQATTDALAGVVAEIVGFLGRH
ncbi:hypothetical protein [Woeseia oceani]|uniref:hypothetical protein n=1 Tax=Woeseia oceani TaxID=1548547 RepID=UPI0009F51795|nr:hypothetical protein [Woeseia oceani]